MVKAATARGTFSPVSSRTRNCTAPINARKNYRPRFSRSHKINRVRVPAGTLTSYGQLSAAIGCPGASRAVGSAVGANPIAFIIPCHRVIRETGVLGNYRWDPIRKCAMIGWEISARSPLRTGEPYRIQPNAA